MTQSGTHARRYRWFKTGCSDALTGSTTFTVLALNGPSSQSATQASSTQINLAWTRGVTGAGAKDTLILRNTADSFTAPTQGTAYIAGNTIGSATVVYKGSGTSFSDTGRSPGTHYYYRFYAENSSYYSTGTVAANACTAPTIATQPTDQVVCSGSNATFALTANGSGVTYQWRKNGGNISDGATGNGSTYSGTTTATLPITGAVAGDAATGSNGYDCVVTDPCGVTTVTSTRVALTVTASIVVNTQPADQTACSSPGTASYAINVT